MTAELETRLVPWERREGSYARNRDPAERPPIPRVGDRLYVRMEDWSPDVILCDVVAVQSLDDLHDPNIGYTVKHWDNGLPVLDAGRPRLVRVADPWPLVHLRLPGGDILPTYEARLRGSRGWLPLNYLERPVRLPSETIVRPLRPVNW